MATAATTVCAHQKLQQLKGRRIGEQQERTSEKSEASFKGSYHGKNQKEKTSHVVGLSGK